MKKKRFEMDGFNLDLAYITERIVAMAYPAGTFEKIYRNNISEIKRFFKQRHNGQYKVFNLCIESDRNYSPNTFENYSYYPFHDHNSPKFADMFNFCQDAKEFLDQDEKNVIAVHCKAGKSRTGLMICAYLIYSAYFQTTEKVIMYYNLRRTKDLKGINIPSQ